MVVLAIIQARMGSTRLSGKILKKLNGKPILQHIVEFLKFSKNIDKIVVATTVLPEDDIVELLCKQLDIDCFRGSSSNVLERFYVCAKKFNADFVIRFTADNPLINPEIVDELVNLCKKNNCDYASNSFNLTFPYGYSTCEVFPFSTLTKLYQTQTDTESLEHVTISIRNHPELFTILELKAPENLHRPDWKLSVDTADDYFRMKKIFSSLYRENSFIDYSTLINFLDKNKQLFEIDKKN